MILEGVVTNVTTFGCFVDIGVHQDGLVHISELSDDFVANPAEVVKPQDIVKVQVLSVDEARKRIGLSMKTQKAPAKTKPLADKKTDGSLSHTPKKPFSKNKIAQKPTEKLGSFGALLKQAGLG